MKGILSILLLISFQLSNGQNANDDLKQDSIKSINPDYFKINKDQFEKFKSGNYSNWFLSNDNISKLYFVPYTDYSITTVIITTENQLPKDIIQLLKFEGVDINNNNAIKVDEIKSQKGIKLGANKKSVLDIYGRPKSTLDNDDKETLVWVFKILGNNEKKVGHLEPFILEGLEFKVEMTFQKDKLVTLIYRYEVP